MERMALRTSRFPERQVWPISYPHVNALWRCGALQRRAMIQLRLTLRVTRVVNISQGYYFLTRARRQMRANMIRSPYSRVIARDAISAMQTARATVAKELPGSMWAQNDGRRQHSIGLAWRIPGGL